MNRRKLFLLPAAVLMIAVCAAVVAPSSAHAQIASCTCKWVPITVDPLLGCNVQIRVTRPGETPFTLLLAPGNTVSVQCADGITFEMLISGGCWVNLGNNCTAGYSVAGGCCVNACLQQDAAGCWTLRIKPHTGRLCLSCGLEIE